jgi:hypothetical protein
VNGPSPRLGLAIVSLACLGAALLLSPGALATGPAPAVVQDPEGVVFNAADGTYTVHRVPKRSLDVVTKSLADWQHQVLGDDSTADYSAEDGILSMECSACGLSRPSAIDIVAIDLGTIVAYEAGAWHIGIRSKDGTQDFFGVLHGEIGPDPHDPSRVGDDRRNALAALADLYDLAYLTQNPPVAPAPAKGSRNPPPVAAGAQAPKPPPTSLAALAANGDVEGIQALPRAKVTSRDGAHALETAYGLRARTQMLDGQVDAALQTLSVGRQNFGKSTVLRDLEVHYVTIGDAYDRLRLAVKLDITELRSYLQQIQTLEPNDATPIEEMLVRVLSNRIADQRATGRVGIADELLSSGRDLFPVWADRLTQGTAGALPERGVEVGTVETPAYHHAK